MEYYFLVNFISKENYKTLIKFLTLLIDIQKYLPLPQRWRMCCHLLQESQVTAGCLEVTISLHETQWDISSSAIVKIIRMGIFSSTLIYHNFRKIWDQRQQAKSKLWKWLPFLYFYFQHVQRLPSFQMTQAFHIVI